MYLVWFFVLFLVLETLFDSAHGQSNFSVKWFAPFFSGGGYSSEAFSFVSILDKESKSSKFELSISQHGDSFNQEFVNGLTKYDLELLMRLKSKTEPSKNPLLSICHSEPGAWHAPSPNYHTTRCPPSKPFMSASTYYSIGRTMFETDRIPSGWVTRLNFMDEVWVPTKFAHDIFNKVCN